MARQPSSYRRWTTVVDAVAAITWLIGVVTIVVLSLDPPEKSSGVWPVGAWGTALALSGAGVGHAWLSRSVSQKNWSLALVVVMMVGLRVVFFAGSPVLENDFWRYLWDGAQVAEGLNPFNYAPQEVRDRALGDLPDYLLKPHERQDLKHYVRVYRELQMEQFRFHLINYPMVPTIYPPLSQLFFAASAVIAPGKVWPWKLIIIAFELLTMVVLFKVASKLPKNATNAIGVIFVFGTSPLLLKELTNSLHHDVIGIFAVTFMLLGITERRWWLTSIGFTAACLTKLIPIIWLPLLWRELRWKGVLLAGSLFVLGYAPLWFTGQRNAEGLRTFTLWWEFNPGPYTVWKFLVESMPIGFNEPTLVARGLSGCMAFALIGLVMWWFFRKRLELFDALSLSLLCFLVCAPVVNPWYFTWLVGLAVLTGRSQVLAIGASTGLSYHYYAIYRFIPMIQWLQWLAIIGLLIWAFRDALNAAQRPSEWDGESDGHVFEERR